VIEETMKLVYQLSDGRRRLFEGNDRGNPDAGLPRIRLHDLRHTYATVAHSASIHPKIVSERVGSRPLA
jgi:integrase